MCIKDQSLTIITAYIPLSPILLQPSLSTCKLASFMMMMMNQQANNDRMSKALNPAAKPFSPLHRNHYPNLSALAYYNTYAAAPPFTPMLYQPHILPVSEYYYQPCPSEYITPGQVFVHPSQPQPQYYAANLYNPMQQDHFGASRPIPFVAPQFFGPAAPCLVPNTGCHSLNYGAPPTLRENIVKQIEYYFSDENLEQDNYLISLMDDKGWVPISTIAGFNRIKAMCKSIPFILDSLFDSSTVERHGNMIRRRDGWSKWISSARIKKQKIKVSPLEQIPTSGVSILTTLATPQVEVDIASKIALNEYVDKIVNNELSEPLMLEDLASVDMVEQNGCLESSSPKYFEKAQASRSLLDVEFVRAYLAKGDEVLKEDRFSDFRPHAQKKKIKEPVNTKPKPFQVTLLGRCPTRNRTRTTLLHLQYMSA